MLHQSHILNFSFFVVFPNYSWIPAIALGSAYPPSFQPTFGQLISLILLVVPVLQLLQLAQTFFPVAKCQYCVYIAYAKFAIAGIRLRRAVGKSNNVIDLKRIALHRAQARLELSKAALDRELKKLEARRCMEELLRAQRESLDYELALGDADLDEEY